MFKIKVGSPKSAAPKAPKLAAGLGIKTKPPRHTVARPRLHRQHMQGLGKSAFAPPGASMAFNDPEAQSAPGQAFPTGAIGGGGDAGGAPQAGPPEPGESDSGAMPGM